jgi:hypothetical protein
MTALIGLLLLTRLGGQFPTQLLDNPALDFMLLENPGLFSEVPEETLAAIAKREDCPPEMLGHLARGGHGKGLLMSLVQNGATPAAAIRDMLDTPVEALAERYETPEDTARTIQGLASMHVSTMPEPSIDAALAEFGSALTERLLFRRRLPAPNRFSFELISTDEWSLLQMGHASQTVKDDVMAWNILLGGVNSALRRLVMPAPVIEAIACRADRRTTNLIEEMSRKVIREMGVDLPYWLEFASGSKKEEMARLLRENAEDVLPPLTEMLGTQSLALRLILARHPLAERQSESELLDALSHSPADWVREFVATETEEQTQELIDPGRPLSMEELLNRELHEEQRSSD